MPPGSFHALRRFGDSGVGGHALDRQPPDPVGGEHQPGRRDVVGFVFQSLYLISTLTAREDVAVLAELTRHDQPGRVDAVLSDVGLTDLAEYFPSQVSGGQ
jgi:predicted ABC-type transport system involved in lysophospholipase L1 biosynthesis ATPase subunit